MWMAQTPRNEQLKSHLATVEKERSISQTGTFTRRLCNPLAQQSLPICLFLMALVKRNIIYTHISKSELPNSLNAAKYQVFFLSPRECLFLTHTMCQCSLLLLTCYRSSTGTPMVIIMFLVTKNDDRSIQIATLKQRVVQLCYSSLTQVSIRFREVLENQQCTNLEVIFWLLSSDILFMPENMWINISYMCSLYIWIGSGFLLI